MRIIAIVLVSLSVLLTPLPLSAAKGGEKGPADQAWERANERARFKRDQAGSGDMGEERGKKQKEKHKGEDDDNDRDKYKENDNRSDKERDRDDDDDRDREMGRDRDKNHYDDRDEDKAKKKAKKKGRSAEVVEGTDPREQKPRGFWNRMKFWERQPAE